MKRLLAVTLPAGLAVIAAILLLSSWRSRGDGFEARLERSRLKREFAERSALARTQPVAPLDAWRTESAALLRWYVEGMAAVRNRHPREPARPAEAGREEGLGGSAKDKATVEEFRRYAEERWALVRGARYAPQASAVAGGLRLDLLSIQPGPSPEGGGPGLKVEVALWGVPRLLEREGAGEKGALRTVLPVSLRQLSVRLLDEKGALFGGMVGGGEPHQKLADGERFVEDFPPAILFATYWLELLPRPPATVELELAAAIRGADGRERPVALALALPIEDAWRLPPGAEFKAEVREGPRQPAR